MNLANNTSSKSKLGMKVAKKEKPILSLKFILQSLKEICELPDKPQITNSVTLNLIIFILQTCLIQLKNVKFLTFYKIIFTFLKTFSYFNLILLLNKNMVFVVNYLLSYVYYFLNVVTILL